MQSTESVRIMTEISVRILSKMKSLVLDGMKLMHQNWKNILKVLKLETLYISKQLLEETT